MIQVHIVGLRELNGRFASMADHELQMIQMQEAEALVHVIEQVYRRHAPRSVGLRKDEGRHFYEGIQGHAVAKAFGFALDVQTDKPVLAGWLREGTRPHEIRPKNKLALFWPHASHPVKRVQHPGTKPNPWQREAEVEVRPFAQASGNRIGQRVAVRLAGFNL